jgi:hypothetical protein
MNLSSKWKMAPAVVIAIVSAGITAQYAHAQTFSTLYSFPDPHGGMPLAELVQGTSGDLYGTQFYSGLLPGVCSYWSVTKRTFFAGRACSAEKS